jgi:hypothetical protein
MTPSDRCEGVDAYRWAARVVPSLMHDAHVLRPYHGDRLLAFRLGP